MSTPLPPASTPLPEAPNRSQNGNLFVPIANAFVGALEPFRQQMQALADYIYARVSEAFAAGLESVAPNALIAEQSAFSANASRVSAANSANSASSSSATAGNRAAEASSSRDAANAALLALGSVLANGVGAMSVNADGDLIVSWNEPTVSNISIDANGDLIVTYP